MKGDARGRGSGTPGRYRDRGVAAAHRRSGALRSDRGGNRARPDALLEDAARGRRAHRGSAPKCGDVVVIVRGVGNEDASHTPLNADSELLDGQGRASKRRRIARVAATRRQPGPGGADATAGAPKESRAEGPGYDDGSHLDRETIPSALPADPGRFAMPATIPVASSIQPASSAPCLTIAGDLVRPGVIAGGARVRGQPHFVQQQRRRHQDEACPHHGPGDGGSRHVSQHSSQNTHASGTASSRSVEGESAPG